MRPLSFTKNLGGLDKVYRAIRRGFSPGVTVEEFRKRCGLPSGLALLVVEFFLFTSVRFDKEYIVGDTLVEQTLSRKKFDQTLARLYFFALNLGLPGERISKEQREAGQLQRHVVSQHIYVDGAWNSERLQKDESLEPFVRGVSNFPSVRKWVNNYWFMLNQCKFVEQPDGTLQTFPDAWGFLALKLFFERYSTLHPSDDPGSLARAALDLSIQKLIGVPQSWLVERVEGAADMFANHDPYDFPDPEEEDAERIAAIKGESPPRPRPGTQAERRTRFTLQMIRRGENRKFIQSLYQGECQVSGVVLRLPHGETTVDCAHIRPLGLPHSGPDDVGNMLSLSPTMHRLFDRGCIRIDPSNLSIHLLHGNKLPHFDHLHVKPEHGLSKDHIDYFNRHVLA